MQIKGFKYAIFDTHKAGHSQINGPYQNPPWLEWDPPETRSDLPEYATKASREIEFIKFHHQLIFKNPHLLGSGDERERPTLAMVLLALTLGTWPGPHRDLTRTPSRPAQDFIRSPSGLAQDPTGSAWDLAGITQGMHKTLSRPARDPSGTWPPIECWGRTIPLHDSK
jgi:hypothetical protein